MYLFTAGFHLFLLISVANVVLPCGNQVTTMTTVISAKGTVAQGAPPPNQRAVPPSTTPIYSNCGHSQYYYFAPNETGSGIVGGVHALPNQYPWIVRLEITLTDGSVSICSGSLISQFFILTAAHCLVKTNGAISIYVGSNAFSPSGDPNEYVLAGAKFWLHPGFNPGTYEFDLAIIRIAGLVNFTSNWNIQPICLPTSTRDSICSSQTAVFIAGWGVTDTTSNALSDWLMTAYVQVVDMSMCKSASRYADSITDNMICAGFSQGGADTCTGDSGGPLMTNERGFFQICGVASFGYGCGNAGYPGVYTKVAPLLSWITKITG